MKDIVRFALYAAGSLTVILLLIRLAKESVSGYTLLPLALVLIIVVPVVVGIAAARRERLRRDVGNGGV
jgi:ABC-type proline/glycine betaine transport system permease subunit